MRLPLLISVPHAGERIANEVKDLCILKHEDLIADGDEGAGQIYDIGSEVSAYLTTDIARAVIDLNRAPDDFSPDGVIKTHTCWNKRVYKTFPTPDLQKLLLEKYYTPYHQRLTDLAGQNVLMGVDCHTMAEFGPPVGPDQGEERPMVCISNGNGTCPDEWFKMMLEYFREEFGQDVRANDPFKGGYITRQHSKEMPWLQLEISRSKDLTNMEKREKILKCLYSWHDKISS